MQKHLCTCSKVGDPKCVLRVFASQSTDMKERTRNKLRTEGNRSSDLSGLSVFFDPTHFVRGFTFALG